MELHFVTCEITTALATFWALDKPRPMYHNIFHDLNPKEIFFERSKLMFPWFKYSHYSLSLSLSQKKKKKTLIH